MIKNNIAQLNEATHVFVHSFKIYSFLALMGNHT